MHLGSKTFFLSLIFAVERRVQFLESMAGADSFDEFLDQNGYSNVRRDLDAVCGRDFSVRGLLSVSKSVLPELTIEVMRPDW